MSKFSLAQTLKLLQDYDSDIPDDDFEVDNGGDGDVTNDISTGNDDLHSNNVLAGVSQNVEEITVHVYDSLVDMDTTENTVTLQVQDLINNPNNSEQPSLTTDNNQATSDQSNRGRTRVRKKETWEKEVRKRKRQSGQEYVNTRGHIVCEKKIRFTKDCSGKCKYKCGQIFSNRDVENIHRSFWNLSDNEKYGFYGQTTQKQVHGQKKKDSRRKNTYKYFFFKGCDKIQVCKEFYLSVLQIADSRVRRFYDKASNDTQFRDMRGQYNKVRTDEESLQFVRDHINSFNRVPSHYCRSSTTREYLESGLSIPSMYEMYTEKCQQNGQSPLKISMYRKIFKEDFNICFQKPRKDRCDICEEMKIVSEKGENSELYEKYEKHQEDKCQTKLERDSDRSSDKLVICFDLENVITLPKADVKNFFYKRKLNTFNLTAHCSQSKSAYNAIWCEAVAGRGANEIASALVAILKSVKADHPEYKSYTLWSDSCVAQNRNSIMTFALKRFMIDNNVDEIIQKYSCPGHSAIQEVDNIHSHIEKVLKAKEVYSPVSLVRVIKGVRRKTPFKIIQMQKHHFTDYQKAVLGMKFQQVPYTKVKCLRYVRSDQLHLDYKVSFSVSEYKQAEIIGRAITRNSAPFISLPIPRTLVKQPVLSTEKRKDLSSMLKYMCQIDRQFYIAMKIPVVSDSS